LAALGCYARVTFGADFVDLAEDQQDRVLEAVEDGDAANFLPDSATFFRLLREHTWQGMFGDPAYGGNEGFVGWDLIGFPGLRLEVGPQEQELDVEVTRHRQSVVELAIRDGSKGPSRRKGANDEPEH
jgi:gluconate 2-dehydrogenase gamma chain